MSEGIEIKESVEFKEINNLTFAFTKKIITIQNKIASAEITPAGIIYTENSDYYFAPLNEDYNLEKISKEYVKHLKEEEYPHFQQ